MDTGDVPGRARGELRNGPTTDSDPSFRELDQEPWNNGDSPLEHV